MLASVGPDLVSLMTPSKQWQSFGASGQTWEVWVGLGLNHTCVLPILDLDLPLLNLRFLALGLLQPILHCVLPILNLRFSIHLVLPILNLELSRLSLAVLCMALRPRSWEGL